jgi:hypothetical protein
VGPEDVARELEHPAAHELLSEASVARLAYNGPDGFPRVVPCGFWWNGTHVVVCTAITAPKVRALQARPEVALTIDVPDAPGGAKELLLRGVASVEIVEGVADEYLAASRKGIAEEHLAEFERNVRATYDQMARISIEPRWARLFDFGTGRMPKFLTELVQKAAE